MKVFAFDPATGRRGEHLHDAKRCLWTGQGYDYALKRGFVEPIEVVMPQQRPGVKHTIHLDAGSQGVVEGRFNDWSYQCDEWITFCCGKIGKRLPGGEIEGDWEWVILPPKSLIRRTEAWDKWLEDREKRDEQ